jgi:hypothetical protein
MLVRFRHPGSKPIQRVTVDGRPHEKFDAAKGDVDITGLAGKVEVIADY